MEVVDFSPPLIFGRLKSTLPTAKLVRCTDGLSAKMRQHFEMKSKEVHARRIQFQLKEWSRCRAERTRK